MKIHVEYLYCQIQEMKLSEAKMLLLFTTNFNLVLLLISNRFYFIINACQSNIMLHCYTKIVQIDNVANSNF